MENHKRPMRGPMGHRGMRGGEKAKDFKGTIRKLFKYVGSSKYAILIFAIFAIGSTMFNVIAPKTLGKATNELQIGFMSKLMGTGQINFDNIGHILLLVLVIYALSAVFNLVQGFIMTGITQKLCYRMRKEISEK